MPLTGVQSGSAGREGAACFKPAQSRAFHHTQGPAVRPLGARWGA